MVPRWTWPEARSPPQAPAFRRRSSRCFKTASGLLLLLRVEVIAPVLLPGLLVVPRRLRLLRPEADGSDLLRLHAQVVEILLGRVGPPLPQRQVVLAGAALVRVALDPHLQLGVLDEDVGHVAELLLRIL